MENLSDYRKKIDAIDAELITIYEKRMETVLCVAEYKKTHAVDVLQQNREDEVIKNALKNIKNHDLDRFAIKFMNSIMQQSREYQKEFIGKGAIPEKIAAVSDAVGFQGTGGSFSEEALISFFGKDKKRKSFEDFEDVFKAIADGTIKYGVLPLENSGAGAVSDVYDLLLKYGFYIVGEKIIPITHNLVGIKSASLDTISEIYSHPQGLMQCSNFLRQHRNIRAVPYQNTALSAKFISEQNCADKAAIASKRAAEIYGLDIIKPAINNSSDNFTRFIIIGKEKESLTASNKVSVVFSLEHEAGTLYRLLSYFADNSINMNKIESRPCENSPWKYVLYVDFEGSTEDKNTEAALARIKSDAEFFKLLGCYGADK